MNESLKQRGKIYENFVHKRQKWPKKNKIARKLELFREGLKKKKKILENSNKAPPSLLENLKKNEK